MASLYTFEDCFEKFSIVKVNTVFQFLGFRRILSFMRAFVSKAVRITVSSTKLEGRTTENMWKYGTNANLAPLITLA